jgi:hypothetical protein
VLFGNALAVRPPTVGELELALAQKEEKGTRERVVPIARKPRAPRVAAELTQTTEG